MYIKLSVMNRDILFVNILVYHRHLLTSSDIAVLMEVKYIAVIIANQ